MTNVRSAIPPTAAERHEKRRGVGETRRLGLHAQQRGAEVDPLCGKHGDLRDLAILQLHAHDIKAALRGVFALASGFDRPGVHLQGTQRVGDVLKGVDDRAAILRVGLLQSRDCRTFLVQQRHAVEKRLRGVGGKRVEPCAGRKELRDMKGAGAEIGGERDIRQPAGARDADRGGGGMKIGLGGANVRTLRDERRGHAHRNCPRQLQLREPEFLFDLVKGEPAGESGQEVALERELLFKRRQRLLGLRERRLLRNDIGLGD